MNTWTKILVTIGEHAWGVHIFQLGPYISEIYGLGGPNISKYMDRGEQKGGGVQICRDSPWDWYVYCHNSSTISK